MPFKNRVRLPIEITKPQWPTERTVFRKANGQSKTISATVKKTMEGETDWMPEKWHEKLVIALNHDEINIEGDKYLGGVSLESDYDVAWQGFLNYPTAPAKFKVQITPFDATNSNCQTCEEAVQLSLTDDTLPESLLEDTTYTWNLADNDSICCYPSVFSISGVYDANFLEVATLDQEGNLSITVKADVVTTNNVLLLTYRVTCPNGSYDEAKVYGNIVGSVDSCLAPLDLHRGTVSTTTASALWTSPDPAPANGYIWDLFLASSPGFSEQSGTTMGNSVSLENLTPGSNYVLYVRSDCGGSVSNDVSISLITPAENNNCGNYEITYQIQVSDNPDMIRVSYLDCNGHAQTEYIVLPNIYLNICALQARPGVPLHILTTYSSLTDIDYLGLC